MARTAKKIYQNVALIRNIFLSHFKHGLPSFSACLFLELFQTADNNPYVQIFYRNSTKLQDIPLLLEFPECGVKCPLKKIYELYKNILPTKSYHEECALRDGEHQPRSRSYALKESQK